MSCPTRGRVSFLNFNPAAPRSPAPTARSMGVRDAGTTRGTPLTITFAFLPNRAVALSHFFSSCSDFSRDPSFHLASPLAAAGIDKIIPRQNAAFTRSPAGGRIGKPTWNFSGDNSEYLRIFVA